MFEGFLEIIVRHADHGDTLLNGYPGTRVPGPKNPAGFGSDPDPVAGITCPGRLAGYPGSQRTGGTRSRIFVFIVSRSLVVSVGGAVEFESYRPW